MRRDVGLRLAAMGPPRINGVRAETLLGADPVRSWATRSTMCASIPTQAGIEAASG